MALWPRTSLQLGGPARYFLTAESEDDVAGALGWARQRGLPVAVLGGGSNLVIADRGFEGLVLHIALRGLHFSGDELIAQAGEPWDAAVSQCIERGLGGLECLSGIPGLVGATPIQNVGAYGQEVADTIQTVRVLDRETLQVHELGTAQCAFAYRDSAFKHAPHRHVVLAVRYRLRAEGGPRLRYAELRRALSQLGQPPSLSRVRQAVLALRRQKSMVIDEADENRRSAGSFFVNPVVDAATAERVVALALDAGAAHDPADVPRHPAPDGRVKLAAGWLIEHAGLAKGTREGAVGLSSRHALAVVHHGGGSSDELLAFARKVQTRVHDRFGVRLQPEPVFLGFGDDFAF